jgi:hypothetical protein
MKMANNNIPLFRGSFASSHGRKYGIKFVDISYLTSLNHVPPKIILIV